MCLLQLHFVSRDISQIGTFLYKNKHLQEERERVDGCNQLRYLALLLKLSDIGDYCKIITFKNVSNASGSRVGPYEKLAI